MSQQYRRLDEIMEDLACGHNFDYAGKAIAEWHEAALAKATAAAREDELTSIPHRLLHNPEVFAWRNGRIQQLESKGAAHDDQ